MAQTNPLPTAASEKAGERVGGAEGAGSLEESQQCCCVNAPLVGILSESHLASAVCSPRGMAGHWGRYKFRIWVKVNVRD